MATLVPFLLALAVGVPDTVALIGFHVLDVETGLTAVSQTVLVADGLIYEVGSAAETVVPANASRIEGRGRTLVPGLVDAHAHVDSIDFGLFLANGVTAVRELNGSPRHLAWRGSLESGVLLGPRLLVASPLLSGAALRYRHEVIESPGAGSRRIRELKSEGYDYAKIYDDLSRDTYQALTETAREVGLPYVGHIPTDVGLETVLDAGQAIEHAEKIVAAVLGHGLKDLSLLAEAADLIAKAGVTVTPTLAVHEVLNSQHDPAFPDRFDAPELAYVDSATVAWWTSLGPGGHLPQTVEGELWPVRFLRAQRLLVKELADRGVPLLVGTDTPNPLMVPGFSVHDELAALVRAGLPSLSALQAATLVPGRILPFAVPVGRIASGYAADLIAISSDPLGDLSVLRQPVSVMTAGRWLDRAAMDALLEAHPQRHSPEQDPR